MGFLGGTFDAVGSVAGDVVGGLAGGLSKGAMQNNFQATSPGLEDQERKKRFADAIAAAQGMSGPQGQFRQGQIQNINDLQDASMGRGPSVADQTMRTNQESNLAQGMAMAGSQRGNVNPGMVMRQTQQGVMQANQAALTQAMQAKMQEQMNARAQLAQALAAGRGQDLQSNSLAAQYEAMGLTADQAQLQAAMQAQQINAGISTGNIDAKNKFVGGLISGGSQVGAAAAMPAAAASDRRLKKDVEDGGEDIGKFLDALKAHKYKYKNPERDGEGDQISVMAQELEKTPAGKAMVVEAPHGKMVDYGKGFGAILAATAHLHERMKKIEGTKGGK